MGQVADSLSTLCSLNSSRPFVQDRFSFSLDSRQVQNGLVAVFHPVLADHAVAAVVPDFVVPFGGHAIMRALDLLVGGADLIETDVLDLAGQFLAGVGVQDGNGSA